MARRPSIRSLARWCVTHRRLVVAGWLVALIGLTLISQSVGSTYSNDLSLPGAQSFKAQALLQEVAPSAAGDREQIVIAVKHGKVTDPAVRTQVARMLSKVAAMGEVASVTLLEASRINMV